MSVTATDLQNLIITSLSDADPTAVAGLQANVPKYWSLWNRQGVLIELQYWYTRRDAIRYLMACINSQTDFLRRTQSASRAMTLSSLQNATMSASGSEVASSLANRSSSSSYSDGTVSTGTGSSLSNRNASQSMSGSSSLSDTGSGTNSASQSSSLTSSSTVNASSSDSTGALRYSIREVCGYHERDNGSGKASLGIQPGIGGAVTDSFTIEREYGTITQTNSGAGNSAYTAKQNDTRANSSIQESQRASSSSFTAHRITADTMSSSGSSHFTASSASSFSMSGSGSGAMTGTGAGGSAMTASSSRVASSAGEAHRLSNAASQMNSSMERLHQRFLHLRELWVKANEMIKVFEKQRLNLSAYTMQAITIQYPTGVNADTANAFLVRTPFGTGNGQ
jgi:hypothetical protein